MVEWRFRARTATIGRAWILIREATMPRRSRITLSGVPVHIIQRGNNRCACFDSQDDRSRYLSYLEELSRQFGCAVHAYVLMTNHVHLLLTPETKDSSSLMMKHLGQRYVQYFNRRHARSGTLWEGRFRSCLVEEEAYLLRCYRYIELNPVRARMVERPQDYDWSSHGFNALGRPSTFLVPHACLDRLGMTDRERRANYCELVRTNLDDTAVDEIRDATNGNYALGSERFRRKVETTLNRRASRGRPGRPANSPARS